MNLNHIQRKLLVTVQCKCLQKKLCCEIFFFSNFMILFLSVSFFLWTVFDREKASLQHEIEDKEDMIRQRNGEIQVHSLFPVH